MKTKNDPHVAARDRKLAERYYYWTEIQRRRFDDVLEILEWQEFFVSKQTISNVIKRQADFIKTLKEVDRKQMKLF